MTDNNAGGGIGLGAVVAAVVSWSTNHSILWALVHGFLGWFYLVYRVCGCGGHE